MNRCGRCSRPHPSSRLVGRRTADDRAVRCGRTLSSPRPVSINAVDRDGEVQGRQQHTEHDHNRSPFFIAISTKACPCHAGTGPSLPCRRLASIGGSTSPPGAVLSSMPRAKNGSESCSPASKFDGPLAVRPAVCASVESESLTPMTGRWCEVQTALEQPPNHDRHQPFASIRWFLNTR